METKKDKLGPAVRLQIGLLVLTGALQVDTKLIKGRLNAFAVVDRRYGGAHGRVATLDAQRGEVRAQLVQRDLELAQAVEALACALATDGQPRANPFAAFGAVAPWALKRLPLAQEIRAIEQLVAAVHRSKTASQASRDATQVVQQAARAVKTGLAQAKVLEARLHKARHRRDAIGARWDTELAALKRRTRSAADDGGTALHAALFGRLVLSKRKKKPAALATAVPRPATLPATPDTTGSSSSRCARAMSATRRPRATHSALRSSGSSTTNVGHGASPLGRLTILYHERHTLMIGRNHRQSAARVRTIHLASGITCAGAPTSSPRPTDRSWSAESQ